MDVEPECRMKSRRNRGNRRRVFRCLLLCCAIWFVNAGASSAATLERVEAAYDAATGMGVGKAVLRLEEAQDGQAWRAQSPMLHSDRLLYPVAQPPRILDKLGSQLSSRETRIPGQTPVWFLFRGDEPIELQVRGSGESTVVAPKLRKPLHRRLTNEWWKAQQRWLKHDSSDQESYPPYLQAYLMSVHSRRQGVRLPKSKMGRMPANGAARTSNLLLGSESLRQQMFWEVANQRGESQRPDFELPPPIPFHTAIDEQPLPAAKVEPMADHVPVDCFYIRFGKYSNLLWFQHLLEEHAADIGRLVTLRGTNANYGKRIQSQLVVDKLPFAELIGDKVIADVALIGRDLFLREGAAVALVLQENAPLVAGGLKKMRKERAAADDDVTLKTVKVAGVDVSLLSSPDNRVRSFYVERDGFHFVSNCRWIIDRVLRLKDGVAPLSQSPSFQASRRQLPLERNDTLFAHFSPQFFAGLFSPHYRIEMQRRLRASCELDLVRLASLASVNEIEHDFLGAAASEAFQESDDWLRQLSSIRLLPANFADREDRSRPVVLGQSWVDSRRGGSGTFLPIPDTPVTSASESELSDYSALADFHGKHWGSFDPLVIAISRARDEDDSALEQLTVDARLVTSGLGKYERFTERLGEASSEKLACEQPLIASFHVNLSNKLSPKTNSVFWGVIDQEVDGSESQGGLLGALSLWRAAPAFLTVTDGSLLSGRLFDHLRRFDEEGYFQGVGGLWRRKWDAFTSLSYHRSVLESVTATTAWQETNEPPVHARLNVGCLEESRLAGWLSKVARDRGERASLRNARLMHAFVSQLGVEEETAKEQAELLVGAELICPLGGVYEWKHGAEKTNVVGKANPAAAKGRHPKVSSDVAGGWVSTAWSNELGAVQDSDREYTPAVIRWCRGLDAKLLQENDTVILNAQILIHRQADEPKFEFSPMKFFSGAKKNPKSD